MVNNYAWIAFIPMTVIVVVLIIFGGKRQGIQLENKSEPDNFVLASYRDRAVAKLIDLLIFAIPTIIAFALPESSFFHNVLINTQSTDDTSYAYTTKTVTPLYILLTYLITATLLSSKLQASIGKYIMGLKVVTENGGPVLYMNAIKRTYPAMALELIPIVGLSIHLLNMTLLFTKKRQTPFDMFAKTVVVYRD
jgi:uncharacterized RDD family membrane protein YckC